MATIAVFAPAKVNLTLHVTGRRPDGYHLLDSLVAFADVGDELRLSDGEGIAVDGPESAEVPADEGNLALRAVRLLGERTAIRLTKHLPMAAGLGGGSADAAAALRGCLLRQGDVVPDNLAAVIGARLPPRSDGIAGLGADVPMCLLSQPARVTGIGERIDPMPTLPDLAALLVNPRAAAPTPSVYAAMTRTENAPMPALPDFDDAAAAIAWLSAQRNDLEAAARQVAPAIGTAMEALAALPDCRLARVTGSGATCFGLFDGPAPAQAAAEAIRAAHPDWWVTPAILGDRRRAAQARRI